MIIDHPAPSVPTSMTTFREIFEALRVESRSAAIIILNISILRVGIESTTVAFLVVDLLLSNYYISLFKKKPPWRSDTASINATIVGLTRGVKNILVPCSGKKMGQCMGM